MAGLVTIRELQTRLPWTVRYSRDFRSSPVAHKDFGHALTHTIKACGHLAEIVDDLDHRRESQLAGVAERYIADLVVCALRMANTFPGRTIDLDQAVLDRIATKNEVDRSSLLEPGGSLRRSFVPNFEAGEPA